MPRKHIASLVLALIAIPLVVYILASFQKVDKLENKVIKVAEAEKNNQLAEIARKNFIEGEFAVVVKNLKTGEAYESNGSRKFDSASLYKLWVMALVEKQLGEGSLTPEASISARKIDLDKILSPSPEPPSISPSTSPTPTPTPTEEEKKKLEEKISMTVESALFNMITVSDNYSALLLSQKVGEKNVSSFIKSGGFLGSSFGSPPQTTAGDIATFFERIYKNELVNSPKMIELLKQQRLNDRIPKYLPAGVSVAHKTGELWNSKHDAGIVYGPSGDYVIVVLSESNNTQSASEQIAKFSKGVYDYFENQDK